MEGDPKDVNDDGKQLLPPPKKRGRKKVPKTKQVRRSKERGKYKKSSDSVIGFGDDDLTECLFSDEEVCFNVHYFSVNVTLCHFTL